MNTDAVAISLSGFCIVHCLALPALAALAPFFGIIADAEWLHRLLVVFAVPVALFAFMRIQTSSTQWIFAVLAALGSGCLIAGAFVEALHDYETPLTVAGAGLLIVAHVFRWRRHSY